MGLLIGVGDLGVGAILTEAQQVQASAEATKASALAALAQAQAAQAAAQALLSNISQFTDSPISMASFRANATATRIQLLGINTANDGGGGVFVLTPSDTTSVDDGFLTLVTSTGKRYKREVPDGRITPQMAGAKGVVGVDDSAAFQKFFNALTNYEQIIPAGTYYFNSALTITGKRGYSIRGAGQSVTKFVFMGDSDGLTVDISPSLAERGIFGISGIWFHSAGTKTSRTALRINGNNAFQPSMTLDDLNFTQVNAASQWAVFVHLRDCIMAKAGNITGFGETIEKTIGLLYNNTNSGNNNNPAMNSTLYQLNFQKIYKGMHVEGWGTLGVEGLVVRDSKFVQVVRGFEALSHDYGAPLIDFEGIHIDAYQEAISIDNFVQVSFGANCLFYQTNIAGVSVPNRSVWLKNPQTYRGEMTIRTEGSCQYAVEVSGVGGGANIKVSHIAVVGSTSTVGITTTTFGEHKWDVIRSLGSDAAIANNTGSAWYDASKRGIFTGLVENNKAYFVQTISGNNLDLYSSDPKGVLLPASEGGKTINTIEYRYIGQIVTIVTDAAITIRHQAGWIFLSNMKDLILPAKGRITLMRTQQHWEEIAASRPIPLHRNAILSNYVAETFDKLHANASLSLVSGRAYCIALLPYASGTVNVIPYYVGVGGTNLTANSGNVLSNGFVLADQGGNVLAWANAQTDFASAGAKFTALSSTVTLFANRIYALYVVATGSTPPQIQGQTTAIYNIGVSTMPLLSGYRDTTPLNKVSAVPQTGWNNANQLIWAALAGVAN